MDCGLWQVFYVTVGRGTESFAMQEVRSKLSGHILSQSAETEPRDGKIFFSFEDESSFKLEEIFKLKSVERIFVAILNYRNTDFIKDKRSFLNKLMAEISNGKSYDFAQRVLQQLLSLSSRPCDFVSKILSTDSETEEHQVSKKAKLHKNVTHGQNHSQCDDVSRHDNAQRKICYCCDEDSKYCSCLAKFVQEPESATFDKKESADDNDNVVTFRFSIKCSGRIRKWMNIRKLGKDLSWRVSKATGWKVDLKDPKHELCLHISDQYVTLGIPLTRVPLSRRNYLHDPGLRGPIAWIMTTMAKIKLGDTVLDPMCGKGTLLLESCSQLQEANYIGVDNDLSQLASAIENTRLAGFKGRIHFLHANGLSLPLKDCTVEAVICDAPFNQKYLTSFRADKFYFSFLIEMARVLQMNGNLVLLTSQELSEMVIGMMHIQDTGIISKANSVAVHSSSVEDCLNNIKTVVAAEDDDDAGCSNKTLTKLALDLVSRHNVKLGETLGTILVLKKIILK